MLAETAKLYTELSLRDNGFTRGLTNASAKVKGLNLDTAKLKSGISKVGDGLKLGLVRGLVAGAGAIGFLAYNIRQGIKSLADLEAVTAATQAVLKSTKGVAGQTADSIRELANKYEDLTTVDDKVVQGGENILLTFTNVRKKAFEPALLAALNLSKGMGQSLNTSIVQVGKALNDPIKGITALTRVGVTFTAKQKEQIKTLVTQGKLFEAQKIILKELDREFGGQAKTAADGYTGAQKRMADAVEGLQQALAVGLLPALTKITNKTADFLKDPAVVQRVKDFGDTLAGLFSDTNIDQGVSGVKKFFGYLADLPWGVIKEGIKSSAEGAKRAIDLFKGLPPDLQKGLIGLLAVNKLSNGLIASGIGDLVKFTLGSLKTIYAGNVTVVGASVAGGGIPGGGTTGGGGGLLAGLTPAIISVVAAATVVELARQNDINVGETLPNGTNRTANDRALLVAALKEAGIVNPPLRQQDTLLARMRELENQGATSQQALETILQIINVKTGAPNPRQDPTTNPDLYGLPSATADALAEKLGHMWTPVKLSPDAQSALDASAAQTRRANYLGQRIAEAQAAGNDRRVQRLRNKLDALMSTAEGTTSAVKGNTGVLKNKNFAPTINVRTQFNVSAVAVATSIQRVVLGHKVGFQ